jgi:eukaryotic-like serine/threonine-protein kinase
MSEDSTVSFLKHTVGPMAADRRLIDALNPRYEVLRRLGEGGMASVYLARDKTLEGPVAIKIGKSAANLDRQEREAQALAQITSPHVVSVYDFKRLDQHDACVIMQFIDGNDLNAILASQGAQPAIRVQKWMLEVASGMVATEKARIVHRDLKPSNVIIDKDDMAHITDFGIAYSPSFVSLTQRGDLLGTPLYIAPEQVEDVGKVDTRADIYSFGATFYHVLTGQPPFRSESLWDLLLKHKIEPLVPPFSLRPAIPRLLNDCIERCMAKQPMDRYQSFEGIVTQLGENAEKDPWHHGVDPIASPFEQRYYEQKSALFANTLPDARSSLEFSLPNGIRLSILRGELSQQNVEVIVSSDDANLSMSGGVSSSILGAAGRELFDEASRMTPARQGRVVVTSGGKLHARYVFHGITIGVGQGRLQWPSRDIIAEIVDACLYNAETFSTRSIAFPLLGAGVGKLEPGIALDTIFLTLLRRLLHSPSTLEDVRIVIHRERR